MVIKQTSTDIDRQMYVRNLHGDIGERGWNEEKSVKVTENLSNVEYSRG